MAGFGWSVGDLVTVSKLLIEAGRALKETGGASSDYEEHLSCFQSTLATLQSLRVLNNALKAAGGTTVLGDEVEAIQVALTIFIHEIKQYDPSLGLLRSKGWHREIPKKLKWSLYVSKKASKLQTKLLVPLLTINTSIGLRTFTAISAFENSLPASLRTELSSIADRNITAQLQAHILPLAKEIRTLKDFPSVSERNLELSLTTKGPTSRALHRVQVEPTLKLARGKRLGLSAKPFDTLAELYPILQEGSSLVAENPWSELAVNLRKCIYLLVAGIRQLLEQAFNLLGPRLFYFLVLFWRNGPQVRRMILGESIRFTDALGRCSDLPLQFFCDWKIMYAWLQKRFTDTPGKRYVLAEHFEMQTADGATIKKKEWEDSIRPEMTVNMVMTSSVMRKRGTFCQRCLAGIGSSYPNDEDILSWRCGACGLINIKSSTLTNDRISSRGSWAMPVNSVPLGGDNYESWELALFDPLYVQVERHWAMDIFDDKHSKTLMYLSDKASRSHCSLPDSWQHFISTEAVTIADLTLDNDLYVTDSSICVSYHLEPNGSTLILYSTDTAQVCLPLQLVHIAQAKSCVDLSVLLEGEFQKILTLNFNTWERMVLFFCAFSVLEEQCMKDANDSKIPNFQLEEKEMFADQGAMYDDQSWIARQIQVFESVHTSCVRIQASFSFAPDQWCPLFIAFVSPNLQDETWLHRDGYEITFRELRLYTFSHEYSSRKGHVEDLTIRFGSEIVAAQFQQVIRDLGSCRKDC